MIYPFLHEFDRARYSPGYLRSGVLEAQVQDAVVAALSQRWRARVTVIDSGDRRLRGRMARMLSTRGVNPNLAVKGIGGTMERGILDLAVTFPGGRAGWFECKKPARYVVSPKTGRLIQRSEAGTPTPEQLAFLLAQYGLGAIVGVLWSPSDIETAIAAPGVAA